MATIILEFEKPLIELEAKIDELQKFTAEKGIDFTEEITTLEKKAFKLKEQIYNNLTPYQRVLLARHADRPTTIDYIQQIFTDFVELHGDRRFGDDEAIIGGIARLNGVPVTVLGHLKGKDTKENISRNFGMPHPEGYRKALRLMEQAEKFNRPVVCFIDTPGAYPGIGAEERGQGEAIAYNLMVMSQLKVPVACVVIGEGGSGGALALGVGDKIMMLENSIYSVSTPEAFVSILYKVDDPNKIPEAAEIMKLTAQDLLNLNIIDEIIKEPLGGAHRHMEDTAANVKEALLTWHAEVQNSDLKDLLEKRYQKFRSIGQVISG